MLARIGLTCNMLDRPMPARDIQLTMSERMTALEVRLEAFSNESRDDRQGLRTEIREARANLNTRLDKMAEDLADQVKEQASRIAFVDAVKWGLGMVLAALLGYFSNIMAHTPR